MSPQPEGSSSPSRSSSGHRGEGWTPQVEKMSLLLIGCLWLRANAYCKCALGQPCERVVSAPRCAETQAREKVPPKPAPPVL